MPIQRCTLPDGGSGYKWGEQGKCYASRADALKQARAILAHDQKTTLVSPTGKPIPLRGVRANARAEAIFRKKLLRLVDDMNQSLLYWLSAAYNEFRSEMALDASPLAILQKKMDELAKRWLKNFRVGAKKLAEWHTKSTLNYTDADMKAMLKDAGFTVQMQITPAMQTAYDAVIAEQVGLITNMSTQQLAQIETLVMQSVQAGRDLATLTDALENQFGITRRRAKLIARDQNNKATQTLTRTRQQELGLRQAIWRHSHAGKVPRPSHVKADGKTYELDKGMLLDGKWTFPSELINCFPGESIIEYSAGCQKLFRRRYAGVLASVITKNGNSLKATPNHPILTNRGWIAVKDVNVGDYIVKISNNGIDAFKIDIDRNVTTFAELFNSASDYISPASSIDSAVFKFHGDVANTEVDVINIDGFLPDVANPMFCKKFCELFFPVANMLCLDNGFSGDCALKASASRLFRAPEGIVSGFSAFLPLLKTHSSEADDICLRLSPYLNAAFEQALSYCSPADSILIRQLKLANPRIIIGCNQFIGELFSLLSRAYVGWNNQPSTADMLGDSIRMSANGFRSEIESGSLGEYEFDRVVNVGVFDFSGHVYNLENKVNWYSTDMIISHNCRCFSTPIIPGFID